MTSCRNCPAWKIGICISSKVYEEVRDKLPYSFVDQGDQEVKNVARPVRAYALTAEQIAELSISEAQTAREPPRRRIHWMAAGAVATLGTIAVVVWFLPWTLQRQSSAGSPNIATVAGTKTPSQNPAPRLSIAVLPFSNLSSDPEQEYFADGITEDLTSDLSLIPGSFVIARNTAFTYKGKPVDVKQVGRDLGIRYVLEGSVRRIGDQVRLNAQLIEAETGLTFGRNGSTSNGPNSPKPNPSLLRRLPEGSMSRLCELKPEGLSGSSATQSLSTM